MNETFYSEYGEDKWIAENLPLPDNGAYVDVGCAHPARFSNTAFLRDRGWRGVAIDANPAYAAEWREAGSNAFVVGVLSDQPVAKFLCHENSATSRLCPNGISYACVTLEQIVGWYDIRKIDLLSLDVEGAEYDVFKTLDHLAHEPEIILAEYNTEGLGEDYRLQHHLCGLGYRIVHKTHANIIYVRTPTSALGPR